VPIVRARALSWRRVAGMLVAGWRRLSGSMAVLVAFRRNEQKS
jgi:hypothetical protein